MAEHYAQIRWTCKGPDFLKGRYSREHTWTFDGGLTVPASPSPQVVPAPWSNPTNLDPEEAFVASIASCHMLTFLWLAGRAGFQAESYEDDAVGVLARNEAGQMWVSEVTLRPNILWVGEKTPTPEDLARLHDQAHHQCFIANSVRTRIRVSGPGSGLSAHG
jgi:organic hydroperoxide reductase OsmC/OhrA